MGLGGWGAPPAVGPPSPVTRAKHPPVSRGTYLTGGRSPSRRRRRCSPASERLHGALHMRVQP
eukprot:5112448-Prymnesium_polylepis.1